MSDRYTVAVEGPDGWATYEVSDQQIGLLRAGVPPRLALAACTPVSSGPRRDAPADLTIDRSGRLRGRDA